MINVLKHWCIYIELIITVFGIRGKLCDPWYVSGKNWIVKLIMWNNLQKSHMKVDDYVDNIAKMSWWRRIISTVKQQNNELVNINLSSNKVLSAAIWGLNEAFEITHLYVRNMNTTACVNKSASLKEHFFFLGKLYVSFETVYNNMIGNIISFYRIFVLCNWMWSLV